METSTLRTTLTILGFLLALAGLAVPFFRPDLGPFLPALIVAGGLVGFFLAFVPVSSTELGDWARARTGLLSRVLLGLLGGIALGFTVVAVILAARGNGGYGRAVVPGVTAAVTLFLRAVVRSRYPAPGRDYL